MISLQFKSFTLLSLIVTAYAKAGRLVQTVIYLADITKWGAVSK
jgi:hypothetical protein